MKGLSFKSIEKKQISSFFPAETRPNPILREGMKRSEEASSLAKLEWFNPCWLGYIIKHRCRWGKYMYIAFGNVTSLISQFVCVAQTMQWSFQTLKLTLTLASCLQYCKKYCLTLTTMCATLTSVKCKSRFHFPHTQTPTQRHICT